MKTPLLEIAADWSFWKRPVPTTVERHTADLPSELHPELPWVLTGVRRCGKSTLLSQLPDRLQLPIERCCFLNFEDPRLVDALHFETLDALVTEFEASRDCAPEEAIYFLDEIQVVESWEPWLRAQVDLAHGRRFVVTGSNSRLLSGELGSKLTGRHVGIELFPFDYEEFLALRPGASVDEYLHAGGFPAALQDSDPDRLLRSYFGDIVERDVRERVGARSSLPLRRLVQMVFESSGSELSLRRIASANGIAPNTAALYLAAAESAYLILACPYFAWSERKRSGRNQKYYPVDPGLRRACVTGTRTDRGASLEIATMLLLRRRFRDVYYWRGAGEVDFVILRGKHAVPIQVSTETRAERHERALDAFYREHPHAHESVFVSPESFAQGLPELLP